MKILSILNVSNRENTGSDSGVIFHRLFFNEILNRGHEIVIASPFEVQVRGAQHLFFEPGKNKYDVRFRFDWDRNKEIVEALNPDVIFCHQIEQCAGWRALLVTLGMSGKTKLTTYYHYLPALDMEKGAVVWDPSLNHSELAELILFRVFGALKSSDVFFVTSNYSRNFLFRLAKNYNLSINKEKIVIMPPPADPFFIVDPPMKFDPGRKTILYSSRLYEQYGTDFLLDILEHYKGTDVKFLITDFFANKSAERKKLDPKTETYRTFLKQHENVLIREDGDNRPTYRDEILANSSIVLGPFRKNANWSMGMIDAFMMGIPGIAPNFASFPEFTPRSLLYSDKKCAVELIDRLLADPAFWEASSRTCSNSYEDFLPHKIADIFLEAVL
ncbi:glycosyltransferase [Roseibium sp. M-1]